MILKAIKLTKITWEKNQWVNKLSLYHSDKSIKEKITFKTV